MARPTSLIVPTRRAAVVLALAAPVALVIGATAPGAWIVAPLLGLILLSAVIGDALVAGTLRDLNFAAYPDEEVGAEAWLQVDAGFNGGQRSLVECALALDERLVPGGRMAFALYSLPDGKWQAAAQYRPVRRGTGLVETLWLRWTGPLGLGTRQFTMPVGWQVRVWPNIASGAQPRLADVPARCPVWPDCPAVARRGHAI